MPLPLRLFHASGGLRYHLRARRHADNLWVPFLDRVADWLGAWQPSARRLVLVGPSAGYTLPAAFLHRFREVVAHEPDPLARFLLRRRIGHPALSFEGAVDDLTALASQHPDAAFLFCNLLGQDWTGRPAHVWQPMFADALHGRAWASYHEVASSTRAPDWPGVPRYDACPDFESLMAGFWSGGELVVEDHGTHGLCPHLPREYTFWRFLPERHHLIEWLQG